MHMCSVFRLRVQLECSAAGSLVVFIASPCVAAQPSPPVCEWLLEPLQNGQLVERCVVGQSGCSSEVILDPGKGGRMRVGGGRGSRGEEGSNFLRFVSHI